MIDRQPIQSAMSLAAEKMVMRQARRTTKIKLKSLALFHLRVYFSFLKIGDTALAEVL